MNNYLITIWATFEEIVGFSEQEVLLLRTNCDKKALIIKTVQQMFVKKVSKVQSSVFSVLKSQTCKTPTYLIMECNTLVNESK